MSQRNSLKEIAFLFFKLGAIAFGGPSSHIAMMEDEVVTKRKWMTQEHFLDLIGATNLIPGPNSTEMTMHCGHERAGWKGMFVAGASFIFPAVFITSIFAWLYVEYGELPNVKPFIYGIQAAVISIIAMAAIKLGKKAVKNYELGILGALAITGCLIGIHEIIVLFGVGLLGLLLYYSKKNIGSIKSWLPLLIIQSSEPINVSNIKVFLIFLKVGALLYGSGYVLFAFLDAELVSTGYLSKKSLIDAVAVGQMTPGPVLSTATFIGWQLQGFWGAILATIGIFLPSFIFVLILNPIIPKIRKSVVISAFLDAVNVAAVGLIVAVCFEMGYSTLSDWRTVLISVSAFVLVFFFEKLNSAFIVIAGSLMGFGLSYL